MKTIYTIGYSGFAIEDFIKTIKSVGVTNVVDVRSEPYSSYFSDYNKPVLERTLTKNKISYENMIKEFGAKQTNCDFCPDGFLDFEIFTKESKLFKCGIKKIENEMKNGNVYVLMCAEKEPVNCHRSLLITREFRKLGYDIIHLLPNGKTETQEDVENQLLKKYFPECLEDDFPETEDINEYINCAYRKQNDFIYSKKNKM